MEIPLVKPTAGKILISEPFMGDFFFGRSVVLLIDYNEDGSIGVIMNKPLEIKLDEIVSGFPDFDATIHLGGPVEPEQLFFIHTKGKEISDSNEIIEGLYWGGNLEEIKEMILLGLLKKEDIRFYMGYSGWSAGQLDEELESKSWVVSKTSAKQLIKNDSENLWKKILESFNNEYSQWTNLPIDPSLN